MIRRPPRSTQSRSSAASDVYKRQVPPLIKPLNRFAAATLSKRSYSAPSHQVFVTPRRVRFVESEYAIAREAVLDVLAELRAGIRQLTDTTMFPVEVRVAAADDIWLSTAYGRDTAYVAIHQYTGLPYHCLLYTSDAA